MEPCDSCVKKYGIHDLNSVNNCCFEKCARELGMDNVWDIVPTPCGQNCMECLNKAKLARGRSLCYQRRIGPPPIFVENYEKDKNPYKPYADEHPAVFYISFGISALILALLLAIVVIVIFGGQRRK
jgi:hypothetical protein